MASASSSGEGGGGGGGFDDDVFEIEDFTIVTIKEGLCAELEQLLRKWNLTGDTGNSFSFTEGAISKCEWDSKFERITYGNNHLVVTHYWPKTLQRIDNLANNRSNTAANTEIPDDFLTNAARLLRSSETDFCPGSVICNQFGILEFILLTPSDWDVDKVSNENQLRGLLSAITESVGKAGCSLPIFVQYGEKERQLYFGICQNSSMRTNFESVHQRRGHPLRCHLSGCLDTFKETLGRSLMDEQSVRTSVQFDYVLQDKLGFLGKKILSEEEMIPAEDVNIVDVAHLPFGATSDAIREFGLSTFWSDVREGILREEQNLSNLDPREAPKFGSWVSLNKNASYLMSSCLRSLLKAAESQEDACAVAQKPEHLPEASRALSLLLSPATPQSISISSSNGSMNEDVLKPDVLQHWIDAVFEKTGQNRSFSTLDAADDDASVELSTSVARASSPGPGTAVRNVRDAKACRSEMTENTMDIYQKLYDILSGCKAAPECSLTCRISIALAQMFCARDSSAAKFSQLWSAVTHELQEYYEQNMFLPGMDEAAFPDLSACKLHQNLQLLQCAVEAKKRRELNDVSVSKRLWHKTEDEFFDAQESIEDNITEISEKELDYLTGDGRLKPFGNLRLLHCPDRLLYEPITQSRSPVTEDMLDRHTEYLASLEDPVERVKAQLEPLFSDMEAFKAANPGCCFEDFVRWHSPRDFIVDDESTGEGHLSSRMTGENNTWQETWQQAQPKPIHRQKMLFDYPRAINKIIIDFENLSVSALSAYILPVLFKHAAVQLVEESAMYFPLVGDRLHSFCKKVTNCTKTSDLEEYWDAVKDMAQIESAVESCNVLYTQLISAIGKEQTDDKKYEIRQFVMSVIRLSEQLLENPINGGQASAGCRVPIQQGLCGPVGLALKNIFFGSEKSGNVRSEKRTYEQVLTGDDDTPYHRRQYIVRCCARRPTLGSRALPQRLYAAISKNEYRTCFALSTDTVLS